MRDGVIAGCASHPLVQRRPAHPRCDGSRVQRPHLHLLMIATNKTLPPVRNKSSDPQSGLVNGYQPNVPRRSLDPCRLAQSGCRVTLRLSTTVYGGPHNRCSELVAYSHSIVPGGLLVTSSTTRLT